MMTPPTSLAIVSGATGGIGAVVARRLWESGYSLLCLGRSEIKLATLREWFLDHEKPGQHAYCQYNDLEKNDAHYIKDVINRHLGPLRLLVVCHGATPSLKGEGTEEGLRRVIETDVIGTYQLCEAAALHMKGKWGCIIIVSSLHSRATYPDRLPYSTAKSAISGLVRSWALDWGKDTVRVNAILPWQCEGARTHRIAAQEGEDTLELYKQRSPLRRLVDPEDIAKTVLWLAECESVTGAEIVVDCGVSASMWHRPFEAMGERNHG